VVVWYERGIDIQMATHGYAVIGPPPHLPTLINTNQNRQNTKFLPRPTNRPYGLSPTAHLSIYTKYTQRQKGYRYSQRKRSKTNKQVTLGYRAKTIQTDENSQSQLPGRDYPIRRRNKLVICYNSVISTSLSFPFDEPWVMSWRKVGQVGSKAL
jgi:hypothetical protein